MKTHIADNAVRGTILAVLIMTGGIGCGGDSPTRQVPEAITNSSWRTDLAAFVKEVHSIRSRTSIPAEEGWTVGANNGRLLRLGTIYYKDDVPVGVDTGDKGMDGEFGTEIVRVFQETEVSWRGTVTKVIADNEKSNHVVIVDLPPPPAGADYEFRPIVLGIPFSSIAAEQVPQVGSVVDFKGKLRGQKGMSFKKFPVNVVYWFRKASIPPNGKRIWVLVSIVDASLVGEVKPTAP